MLKRYDTASASWVDAESVKRFDTTLYAWVDAESVKTYDAPTQSWIEKWYKFLALVASKQESSSSSYAITDNGLSVTCSVYGTSDDFFRFEVDGLNIPAGSTLSFNYEPSTWDCAVVMNAYNGTLRLYNIVLDPGVNKGLFECVPSNTYAVTEIVFEFYTPSTQLSYTRSTTISNVQCGTAKFKFTGGITT